MSTGNIGVPVKFACIALNITLVLDSRFNYKAIARNKFLALRRGFEKTSGLK